MLESTIEAYLCKRVKQLGGRTRKCVWVGRRGAPDRLVMLPPNKIFWVELKAPSKKPTVSQVREHELLRQFGAKVFVVDSIEGVDEVLR